MSTTPAEGRDNIMTTAQVAALLRVAESTVRYWRHRGSGPRSFKIGNASVYERADVISWNNERKAKKAS